MRFLTEICLLTSLLGSLSLSAHAQEKNAAPPKQEATRTDKSKSNPAPDIKLEALWDGRKMAPFKALDNPKMVPMLEADYLNDSDYVLGVTLNGESRAYPTRFLWWHHIINDSIGKAESGGQVPIAVTYCSVCNTGICYDPTLDGKALKIDFYGLYNGVVVLCERETESVVLQVEGRFVTGALAGKQLAPKPTLDTTWGKWKLLHPNTLVMSPTPEFQRWYSPKDQPEPRGYDRFPAPFFRPTVTRGDKRLPPFDKVLAVTVVQPQKKKSEPERVIRRAYPIKALQEANGVLNDKVGKVSMTVFLDTETVTANAFSSVLDGKTLLFEARKQEDGKFAFYDKETESRWNIEGLAEEGTLAGKSLARIENHLSQWYGWSAYFPDTSIYGRKDPPQPGNPFEKPEEKL